MPEFLTVNEHLKALGVNQCDFIKKVIQTGINASYSWIDKHCRAWSRDYGNPAVWDAIDSVLDELEGKNNG